MAIVGVFGISILTLLEKANTKPFNPLLGETYELVTHDFEFIAEQVNHHPPITAWHCKGYNSDYIIRGCSNT